MAGTQKFKEDSIGALTKVGSITVQLANSLVTLGGLQYNTGVLSLSTSINGVGGLDSGSVQADTAYYVYIVLDSGAPALVCSLSGSQPSGFDISVKAGAFYTDSAGQVDYIADINTNGEAIEQKDLEVFTQTKLMTATNTPSSMDFNGLTIGKKYRVVAQCGFQLLGGTGIFDFSANHDGAVIPGGRIYMQIDTFTVAGRIIGQTMVTDYFTATATTVNFSVSLSGGTSIFAGGETLATLEEYPDDTYITTTKWS